MLCGQGLNAHAKGDEAVFFSPPLDGAPGEDGQHSVSATIHAIISDFYNIVKFIKRLDRTEGDFLKEMEENEQVRFHVHRIIDECESNQAKCKEYKQPFLKHRALWAKDIGHALENFLNHEGGMETKQPEEGSEGAAVTPPDTANSSRDISHSQAGHPAIASVWAANMAPSADTALLSRAWPTLYSDCTAATLVECGAVYAAKTATLPAAAATRPPHRRRG